jgi:micrococcal nuclease
VDAPEPRNSGRKLKGYFGSESSVYLARLIDGRKVRLEYDVSRYDRYGRTLAYVYLDDGTFVNADLVKKGYATVMTIPPNVRYADEFVKLAEKARKQKRGLWKPDPAQIID